MRRSNLIVAVLASALSAIALLPLEAAHADGAIEKLLTDNDRARLQAFEQTRAEALRQAKTGGDAGEYAVLESIIARRDLTLRTFDFSGKWKCRTIKAGDLTPLVIYGWFDCAVTEDDAGVQLKKLTGSQRTTGRFYDDGDTRMIIIGTGHVNDDPALPYGSGPEHDKVGYAFLNGNGGWRIEFADPYYESLLDVLEFKRGQ
jgi:hypothetical protein